MKKRSSTLVLSTSTKNYIISLFAIIIIIISAIAIFVTYLSSYVKDIKQEKIALENQIKQKEEFYEALEDKIEDVKYLLGIDAQEEFSQNISAMLNSITPTQKRIILNSIPNGYPSFARKITSGFGNRFHPIYKRVKFHHGIDFGGKVGTPIMATAEGIVEFAGYDKGYGYLVVIDHNFGFKTAYGHMLKNLKVKEGDFVKKGEVIGFLGNSGISTGPHLHYEVKFIRRVLDPKNFINWSILNFDEIFYKEKRVAWNSLTKAIMNQYDKLNQLSLK